MSGEDGSVIEGWGGVARLKQFLQHSRYVCTCMIHMATHQPWVGDNPMRATTQLSRNLGGTVCSQDAYGNTSTHKQPHIHALAHTSGPYQNKHLGSQRQQLRASSVRE